MNEGFIKYEKLLSLCLVEIFNKYFNDIFWEFEFGVCICIVLVYNKIYFFIECVEIMFVKNNG